MFEEDKDPEVQADQEEAIQSEEAQGDPNGQPGLEETHPTVEAGSLSEEELDHVADVIVAKLREVLGYFDAAEATIDEYEDDDGDLIFDVNGLDDSILIGKYGRNLAALQSYLVAATVKELGFRYPFTIDIEGYKSRNYARIEQTAIKAAEKAKRVKGPVRMKPMKPFERRIVHKLLTDDPEVTTESEGEGSRRHVVVIYLGNEE
jgi:spoIIIJ-associated protein